MEIINRTPFQAKNTLLQDINGRDQLVVAVKATFTINDDGSLSIADEQCQVNMENEFSGEPDSSSMIQECEATLPKLSTDVIVNGSVWGGAGVTQLNAGIRIGDLKNVCRVFGKRRWVKNLGRTSISDPESFEKISLVYENSFGGVDISHEDSSRHEMDHRNPVGCSFVAKKSSLSCEEIRVPCIEDPSQLLSSFGDRPSPVGFGFLPPLWQPRLSFAGTYDQQWQDERAPQLPEDFNQQFYNSANPKLISSRYFRGGELVELVNIGKLRQQRFELPRIDLEIVNVSSAKKRTVLKAKLNTVFIEPDESRVSLLWKATEDVYQKVHKLWFTRIMANV